jgi:dihydrofolate reductase
MRKLTVFNFLTLNGFYKGPDEDISWHVHGSEEAEFAAEGAQSESVLLFGRKTYEMMAGYWPTPEAHKNAPAVADGMNKSEKIVFSKTLKKVGWNNSKLMKGDLAEEVKKMKQSPGNDITILGSGSIVGQLAEEGLIDVYQFMVDPVVLGDGTPIFQGIKRKLNLKLVNSKAFKSGVVLQVYEPQRN